MATRYVDTTTGDNGDNGTTEALAWATINYAMGQIAGLGAGPHLIHVKGSADYTEVAVAVTVGTATAPVVFRGYTTTPNDGGQVVVDGGSARANGFDFQTNATAWYYIIENFTCHSHTTDGFGGGSTWDNVLFVNCIAYNNTQWGFRGDNSLKFLRCEAYSNSGGGFDFDLNGMMVGCVSRDNSGIGIQSRGHVVLDGVLVFNNEGGGATSQIRIDANGDPFYLTNVTVDGDAASAAQTITGIEIVGAATANAAGVHVNVIINDCDTGVSAANDAGPLLMIANNMYDDCTTAKRSNFDAGYDGIDDPTTPGINADFSLTSGSEAKAAGIDAAEVKNGTSYMDIGGLQREEAGGGGGLLVHPGTSGGARG